MRGFGGESGVLELGARSGLVLFWGARWSVWMVDIRVSPTESLCLGSPRFGP